MEGGHVVADVHSVSSDGRSAELDRRTVNHRGGYQGNAGRAAACRTQRKTEPLLKSLESWLREKMKTLACSTNS